MAVFTIILNETLDMLQNQETLYFGYTNLTPIAGNTNKGKEANRKCQIQRRVGMHLAGCKVFNLLRSRSHGIQNSTWSVS